jgi:hypothetical protein
MGRHGTEHKRKSMLDERKIYIKKTEKKGK